MNQSAADSREDLLERGRAAYDARVWSEAYECLAQGHRTGRLAAADLDRLAVAAHLVGRDSDADEYAAHSFRAWLDDDDLRRAARRAAWLGLQLLLRGEGVRSSAWFARAADLVEELGDQADPERGFLLIPVGLDQLDGAAEDAFATFAEVAQLGRRHGEPDLVAIGELGQGQADVVLGRVRQAMGRLDEAMLAVTSGEVSTEAAGIVYCAVIGECEAAFDLVRARQWTSALDHWCAAQPGLVPFRGICLVHRAHLMQLIGEWADAVDEADHACSLLGGHPAAGEAYYRLGELHRLRGRYADAERCFREAGRWLTDPQPGLALLRLAQGRRAEAGSAIRQALDAQPSGLGRARLLPAYVRIMLESGEPAAARRAATDLTGVATRVGVPLLTALAAEVEGACALSDGDATSALAHLRMAWRAWRELGAPYESARARLQMARCHLLIGDVGSAELELDAAGWVFEQLDAGPDLEQVRRLSSRSDPAGPLTGREVEVLRLVATGTTNRAIAAELFVSEKTVARHLSNIFVKLDVRSRAAATAYAYQHDLV
ncbi:MAG TPA: LuxR C-terminal-related transcriptional regulator [Microlunatus sp.]|nr:LuxR C-terminal-related transcriptional regulator [Microlunatus sp.]